MSVDLRSMGFNKVQFNKVQINKVQNQASSERLSVTISIQAAMHLALLIHLVLADVSRQGMQPWPTTEPMFGHVYSDGRAACKANAVLDAPALSHASSHTPWFLGGFMCAVLVGVVLLQCFPCHGKVQ